MIVSFILTNDEKLFIKVVKTIRTARSGKCIHSEFELDNPDAPALLAKTDQKVLKLLRSCPPIYLLHLPVLLFYVKSIFVANLVKYVAVFGLTFPGVV